MARLLGVEIPNDKKIEISLSYIYGIGKKTALRILEESGINRNIKTGEMTDEQMGKIVNVISNSGLMLEGDLRREIQRNLKRLTSINSYRGYRHRRGLPVRGQRTSTNARTRKGKKRTVGVIRK